LNILISYRGAPLIRGWETGAMIANACRDLGHVVDEYGTIYQTQDYINNFNLPISKNYDLFIYCEMNDPEPQYLALKNINAKKKVGWFFDSEMIGDKYKNLIDYFKFDYVFLANPDTVNYFYNLGYQNIGFLPYAADDTLHYRPVSFPKKYDFALVGSDRPERQKFISDLQSEGLNAHLISGVFREEYIDTLAASKVVINDEAGGGQSLRSMRYYEARCAGAVLLTPGISMTKTDKFDLGVFTYENFDDLVRLCRSSLQSNLEGVAQLGQNSVLKHDTYINRAKRILEVAETS
jgi:hypothetical protein